MRKRKKKRHWHIDYLLANKNVEIVDVRIKETGKKEECETALNLKGERVIGFGCSDCRCSSHLIKIDNLEYLYLPEWISL